uniref:Tc1-like transposase DDE domain-containing protein n=1 Tax=Amphiprion percula TaxID=161767 RepID=A0A3P8T3L4_AMPPE
IRNKILWSDESSFQLYLPPANVRLRRRPACTVDRSTVKHGGGSIMVWRCMSAAGGDHLTELCPVLSELFCRTWLQELSLQVLERPAQSLDMIENLWWIIQRSVSNRNPQNLEELKAVIPEE